VISDLKVRMGEALRLTRAGRLVEATSLLQGLPHYAKSPAEGLQHPSMATGLAGQTIDMVRHPAATDYWTAPGVETEQQDAAHTEDRSPPQMTAALHELLGRFGKRGSVWGMRGPAGDLSARAEASLPNGARWEELGYANEAGSRRYKLFVPSSYCGEKLPLVVMLHGCKQSPDDFAAGTRMNELAEERGFLVAYPGQSSSANSSRCWNWFNADGQLRDRGEPSLIAGITRQIMGNLAADPARVYIAGLSAGGAAAAIMGSAYPDLYAAIGVHSGLACGAAKDLSSAFTAMRQGGSPPPATRSLPTIVFHGDRDSTVSPLNGDQIIAQSKAGRTLNRTVSHGQSPGGIGYTRSVHADENGNPVLEQWVVLGAGHAWSGGSQAASYTDPRGPDASREMLRFFLERSAVAA
jgi:poly(hydroxyalkanoate) depolymerase family esterase